MSDNNFDISIVFGKPPVWDDVCSAFGIKPRAYFTYGTTIYVVDLPEPPKDIIEHEKVHMQQQLEMLPEADRNADSHEVGAALWWGKFLRDPEFRIEQEAKAYARQYQVVCNHTPNRSVRFNALKNMAISLSGPLYNRVISLPNALTKISQYANVK